MIEAGNGLESVCASGAVSRRLSERCRRLTGVDAVSGLVADASRAGIRCGDSPAGFLATDGRLLPFPPARPTSLLVIGSRGSQGLAFARRFAV